MGPLYSGQYRHFTDLKFIQGDILLEIGPFSGAADCFISCISMGDAPINYCGTNGMGSFRAYHNLGKAYEKMGELVKAEEAYYSAVKVNSGYPFPLYALAGLWRQNSNISEVIDRLGKLIDCKVSGGMLLMADILMGTGDFLHAYEFIERAGKYVAEKGGRLFFMAGYCLINLGRRNEAALALQHIYADSGYYETALLWRYIISWLDSTRKDAELLLSLLKDIFPEKDSLYDELHGLLFDGKRKFPHQQLPALMEEVVRRLDLIGENEKAEQLRMLKDRNQ